MIKKILVLSIIMSSMVHAVKEPRGGRLDNRMKTLNYAKNQVYKIVTHYFQDTMIIFSRDEEIVHVGAGDKEAWTITAVGNYLSLKPIDDRADTNLNLLTKNIKTGEMKPYAFELRVSQKRGVTDNDSTYMLTFSYPEIQRQRELERLYKENKLKHPEVIVDRRIEASEWNMDYSFAGNTRNMPKKVFDDGEFTYFEFDKNAETPAIFIVDENNNESLVNFHVKGKYLIVQRTAEQFTLRTGGVISCVFNDTLLAEEEI